MTTYLKEDFCYDADLVLEDSLDSNGDAAAITSSAAGSVLEVAQVIDLGDGLVEGYMIVDIDAIMVATTKMSFMRFGFRERSHRPSPRRVLSGILPVWNLAQARC